MPAVDTLRESDYWFAWGKHCRQRGQFK